MKKKHFPFSHILKKTSGLQLLLLLIAAMFVAGCTGNGETTTTTGSGSMEPATLKIAVLPILDALPMYVAQEQGYFDEQHLTVEFIPVTSAAERDQIIQAGQADGMINEILSTQFYNSETPQVIIVRYARVATPEFPQFYILASAASGITSLDELKGQDIGISAGTIIEYSTDRLLQAEGFDASDIQTVAVPRIPDRLALLISGELPAANMPDPLADLAVQNGAIILVDDGSHPEYGHSTISFRVNVVDENPEAIKRFLLAIEEAVDDINNDKTQFSSLLSERQLVPEPLLGSYIIPDFPKASVPPVAQWEDVLEWAISKDYVSGNLEYSDSIDGSYLP